MMNEGQTVGTSSPARDRLAAIFDDGVYTETGSGVSAGVVAAYGYINGCPAYAFSQDKTMDKGAVSSAHAAKICRVLDLAAKNGVPVVGIYDSCGAFIEDGADALNAYSEILLNIGNLSGVVPIVSMISGVCAGSMAVIAAAADFSVITDSAELYMSAGKDGLSAKSAVECGAVSYAAKDDAEAAETVRKYLSMMPQNNLSPVPEFEYDGPSSASFDTAENAVKSIADADSALEIWSGFGAASVTSIATVGGVSAGVAAVGKNAKISSDDCAKLARFVRLCDAFGLPVVTVIDTEGFADEGIGAVRACARLSGAYAEATCAKIALVSGKACGAAFVALAGKNAAADAVYALPDAVIAPVDPVTAAEFLYHDKLKGAADLAEERNKIAAEYAANEGSAAKAAAKGAVDEIAAPANARACIISVLEFTAGKRLNKRLPKKHSILPL